MENIGDYISEKLRNPVAAANTVRGIKQRINTLQSNPYRHMAEAEIGIEKYEIRKNYYKSYRIYYVIQEERKTVTVLRILHVLSDSKGQLSEIPEF